MSSILKGYGFIVTSSDVIFLHHEWWCIGVLTAHNTFSGGGRNQSEN
jgi:hypothetical protein